MSFYTHTIQTSLPTSTGSQTYRVPGLRNIKGALFTVIGTTNDEGNSTDSKLSFGFADVSDNVWSTSWTLENGSSPRNCNSSLQELPVYIKGTSFVAEVSASLTQFIDDGVILNFTNVSSAYKFRITFFGGTHIEEFYVGNTSSTISSGASLSITDPGFKPSFLIMSSNKNASIGDTVDGYYLNIGYAADNGGSVSQQTFTFSEDDGTSGNATFTKNTTDSILYAINSSGTGADFDVSVSSFDGRGFTLTATSDGASSGDINYVAVKLKAPYKAYVGADTMPSPSSGIEEFTGYGISPEFIMFMQNRTLSASSSIINDRSSHGIASISRNIDNNTIINNTDYLRINESDPAGSSSYHSDTLIRGFYDGGVSEYTYEYHSFTDDGYKADFTVSGIENVVNVLAIGTSEDPKPGKAKIAVVTTRSNGSSVQTFSKPGFGTPKAAYFIASAATTEETKTNHARLSVGATDGIREWAIQTRSENGLANVDSSTTYANDRCIVIMTAATGSSIDGTASFNKFVRDGVELTWNDTYSDATICCILFGGEDLEVRADNTPITNTEDAFTTISDLGFNPEFIFTNLSAGDRLSAPTTFATRSGIEFSTGIVHRDSETDVVTQLSMANESVNGSSPSEGAIESRDNYGILDLSSGDPVAALEFSSFNSSGFSTILKLGTFSDTSDLFYLAVSTKGRLKSKALMERVFNGTESAGDIVEFNSTSFYSQFNYRLLLHLTKNTGGTGTNSGGYGFFASDKANCFSGVYLEKDGASTTVTNSYYSIDGPKIPHPDNTASKDLLMNFRTLSDQGGCYEYEDPPGTGDFDRDFPTLYVEEDAEENEIEIITIENPGTTGEVSYNIAGFGVPKAAMVLSNNSSAIDGSFYTDAVISLGFTDGIKENAISNFFNDNVNPSENRRYAFNDTFILSYEGFAGNYADAASFVKWTDQGVTVNWSRANNEAKYLTLTLFRGSDLNAHVDTFTLPGSQNNSTSITDPNFKPDNIYFSVPEGLYTNTADVNSKNEFIFNFGIATKYITDIKQSCLSFNSPNGVSPTENRLRLSTNRCSKVVGESVNYGLELISFDNQGFTVTARDSNPGSNKECGYLAINFDKKSKNNIIDYQYISSTGEDIIRTLYLRPSFCILLLSSLPELNSTYSSADSAEGVGLSIVTKYSQMAYCIVANDNVSTTDASCILDRNSLLIARPGITITKAKTTDFNSNGLSLNYTSNSGDNNYSVLYGMYITNTVEKARLLWVPNPI